MPAYPKRRFQHGSASSDAAARLFTEDEARYRRHFHSLHA
jgi:asparagine synthase (glutamine-hydrolysing)